MLEKRLEELETASSILEPDADARSELRNPIVDYTELFLREIKERRAYYEYDGHENPFANTNWEQPVAIDDLICFMRRNLDDRGLHPASGGHLGYIPGGGIYSAALGDYIADIFNKYAGIFQTGPGPVQLENALIQWMGELVGYPQSAAGNLTSGGSIANLIAIVTARDKHQLAPKDFERVVVYLSEQSHHCVHKALRIAGLGSCVLRHLPLDEQFRVIPQRLEELIDRDRSQERIPWLVVGNAGSTDTGAIDPLRQLGEIANRENLWFHVDGAYGAFFVMTKNGKDRLGGMELSDSIVMDPHKGLFLPYGLGTVIIKDADAMFQSHYYRANYIQNDNPTRSPADLSPELTKHFRGLRLWLPLRLHGLAPFRAALEEKMLLAQYFWEQLQEMSTFVTGPQPELSVVIYRFTSNGHVDNSANLRLWESINADGRVFISYTTINDVIWLRLAVLSFRTHKREIDILLDQLRMWQNE